MPRNARLATLIALVLLAGACRDDRAALTEPRQPAYTNVRDQLKVDQSNTTTDHLGLANGFYGQSFVPRADNLARVDVLLIINQVPAEGTYTSLGLYTSMNQPAIDSVIVYVAPPQPGEIERVVSHVFSSPLPLVKGATYILGWHGTSATSWELTQTDAYPRGQALLYDGTPLNPSSDMVFTTYALKK
jgi:hypothetical protein